MLTAGNMMVRRDKRLKLNGNNLVISELEVEFTLLMMMRMVKMRMIMNNNLVISQLEVVLAIISLFNFHCKWEF